MVGSSSHACEEFHLKRSSVRKGARATGRSLPLIVSLLMSGGLACPASDPLEDVRALQASGQLEESLEPLRDLLVASPDSAELHYRYGLALTRSGSPGMAVWSLRRAQENPEWAGPASLELARAAIMSMNWTNAIEATGQMLEREPDNVEALEMRAEAFMGQMTEPERALVDLDRAIVIDPDRVSLRSARVRALIMSGQIDDAASALEELESLDLSAKKVDGHILGAICVLRGVFERERGDFEKAEKVITRCLEDHPADGTVVDAAIEFYDGQKQLDESTRIVREALERVPTSLRYRILLASRLRSGGDPEAAEQILREGLRLDSPAMVESLWVALTNHFIELNDDAAAADAYQRAIESSREVSEVGWFTYADLLAAADRDEQALEAAGHIRTEHYRKLIEARVHLNRGEPKDALAILDEVMPLWPNNAGARYFAARASEQLGDLDRAVEEYRQSIRSDAASTDAGLRLAQLLFAMGDVRGAWVACNHFVEAQPGEKAGHVLMMRLALPLGPEAVLSQLQRSSRTRFWPDVIAIHLDAVADRVGPKRAVERFSEFRLDLVQPSNAATLRSMIRHWIASGDPAAARAAVAGALNAHPEEARFHSVAGLEQEILAGSPSAGRSEYAKAIDLDPREAWALEAMGRISAEAGDVSTAVEFLDRAGLASAGDPNPGLQAARLLAGRQESAEESEARWRSLADEFPWEFEPLHQLAQLALARSDRERALVYAKHAVRLGGRSEAWRLLAEVHERRGEAELAKAARSHVRPSHSSEASQPAGGGSDDPPVREPTG